MLYGWGRWVNISSFCISVQVTRVLLFYLPFFVQSICATDYELVYSPVCFVALWLFYCISFFFVPSSLRPFVPSSLRPFVPSSLRPFAPSSLRPFVPSPLHTRMLHYWVPTLKNDTHLVTNPKRKKNSLLTQKRTMTTMKIGGWAL